MGKTKELYYGEWLINGGETALNGVLEINHSANLYNLTLYSNKAISIPYFVDIISGKTHDGKAFTLHKCSTGGTRSSSLIHDYEDKYIYTITCDYVLEGVAFSRPEDVLVKDVYFSITNLKKWAFQNAINVEINDNAEHKIITKRLESITHCNDVFELSIIYITSPDYKYKFTSSLTITTSVQLLLKFKDPTSIVGAHAVVNQVRDFFSLCTTVPTYIEEITIVPYSSSTQDILAPIAIYGRSLEKNANRNIKDLELPNDYISLEQIRESFDTCMKNWFTKGGKLKPVIDSYLSVRYHKTSYERHFLNLVQSLEAYHRLTRKNEILPREEHRARLKSILETVSEEHRDWIKMKLSFSNEPSLHERLLELFTPNDNYDHHNAAKYYHLFVPGHKNKDDLIKDIKNTRNYNTHFDESLVMKAVKGEELIQLTFLLTAMIEYYLLTELEIDEEMVLDITWNKVQRISMRNDLKEYMENNEVSM